MIVGHYFYSVEGFNEQLRDGKTDREYPTGRNLCRLLEAAGIPLAECFFTNLFMGLSNGQNMGRFPGAQDPGFVARCQDFLRLQIELQAPRLILVLGGEVPRFLGGLGGALEPWRACRTFPQLDERELALIEAAEINGVRFAAVCLTHPSLRAANVHRRLFRGLRGKEAERALLRAGLDAATTLRKTWRMRLRFRVQKKLNTNTNEHRLTISKREVILTPSTPDVTIADSEWLVMNARGFATEAEARQYGASLKNALEVSAVACRLGVDAGQDLATSALGQTIKDEILKTTGAEIRNNVHGLDVFPDNPTTRIISFSATGIVRASAEPFLGDLSGLTDAAFVLSQRASDVVLLLNFALMRPEPVAQIVFAVSAVESLGQDEVWTTEQVGLLQELAEAAKLSVKGTTEERLEVSEAIRKLHRLTLRQGVRRLLDRLDLRHLRKPWDDLYDERSTLIHGLAPEPGADYADLAHRTVSLCGQILLKAVAVELPMADRYLSKFYGI